MELINAIPIAFGIATTIGLTLHIAALFVQDPYEPQPKKRGK